MKATAQATSPRRALADDVYAALIAQIMDHDLAPDARLNIEALARSLEVSPTPVREALARLEADGLVRKEPLRGYRTTAMLTTAQLGEIMQFRALIEPWAAATAATRRTPSDLDDLRVELASAPAVTTGTDYADYAALAQHDHRFHALLLRIAGNAVVRESFERTRAHLHMFRYAFATSMASEPVAEHVRIVETVVAGDAGAAHAAMTEHLRAAHARLTSARPAVDHPEETHAHDH